MLLITLSIPFFTQATAEVPEAMTDVRFFGKIFGLNADYYIVEAKIAEPADAPEPGIYFLLFFCFKAIICGFDNSGV